MMKHVRNARLMWVGLMVVVLGLSGCGDAMPTGTVQGTVTLKGKPVEQGIVVLYLEPGRPVGSGSISSGGNFALTEPVPAGNYSVAIVPPGEELPAGAESTKPAQPAAPPIPPKYRNEVTSGLKAAIEPGENALTLQMD